ncbi:MAG: hypothetical protein IJT40_01975 [Firmicutes bacterium]|nr:hypothetical protein [Bacillota bacterium]
MKIIKAKRLLCLLISFAMVLSLMPGLSMTALAEEEESSVNVQTYGDFTFTKISNPSTGSKEPDGINTNDTTGFGPNRLNSYAWAVTTRGDCIYIGTNRTLFGSALNAVMGTINQMNPDSPLTAERAGNVATLLSGGDVPVNLAEEDYIPQIIKFDVANGSTEVLYQPATAVGEDGVLYYLDKDGNIIPNAKVSSETASYRSVIQFKGNMYFGSLGSHMLQLVRVDENDNADVVFQTIGLISSLRACCVYDDGDGETVYFGGQDATYSEWNAGSGKLPIVIRYLDPATAGTDNEDWSGLVADFNDFGKYASAKVYAAGGGNVWDLCSYNGKMYLILAYDGGWAMFRGEKGGSNPNKFGWTWTEIVGDNGKYPLAMNAEVAELNSQYESAYSCKEFSPTLRGAGLLESTATPYVFDGKMYIGSFDNATTIQSETVVKALVKLQYLTNTEALQNGNFGPSLAQIYAPIYEVLSHPQHVWVMDESENISAVDSANELLDGTTNDYVWRFIEHNGKLYTGTFDSSTAYIYFLDYPMERLTSLLEERKDELPEPLQMLLDSDFSERIDELIDALIDETVEASEELEAFLREILEAISDGSDSAEGFISGEVSVEDFAKDLQALREAREALAEQEESIMSVYNGASKAPSLAEGDEEEETELDQIEELIDFLLDFFDGIEYWAKARDLAKNAEQGFDIFVTEDGESWDKIVGDGLVDPYNYGARTFTRLNDELYVGTANPYYGAQLWKVTGEGTIGEPEVVTPPEPIEGLVENGSEQELVTPGEANFGTMYYALSDNDTDAPDADAYSTSIPTGTEAGTYYVWYKVIGEGGRETEAACVLVTIAPKEEEPEPEDNPDPEDEDTPKTGDPNNMMNWILILFGSSAALMSTALFTSRRKKTACK